MREPVAAVVCETVSGTFVRRQLDQPAARVVAIVSMTLRRVDGLDHLATSITQPAPALPVAAAMLSHQTCRIIFELLAATVRERHPHRLTGPAPFVLRPLPERVG